MPESTITSDDSQAPDEEVGELASDRAEGNSRGVEQQPAQPETETEAAEPGEETSQTSESTESESEAEAEDNSELTDEEKAWAAKKNLPLDDPVKLARMYRESEKALGKKGQETGQLKAAVESANTTNQTEDVQALRNEVAALNFYISNPDAKAYEAKMVELLDDKPWLAGDLETVLLAAKGASLTEPEKLVAERQAGKNEALANVAAAERAAPPRTSATTRETPKELTDADIGNMSQAEYQEWRKTHNPFEIAA